jgi:hypothetical protein
MQCVLTPILPRMHDEQVERIIPLAIPSQSSEVTTEKRT